MTDTTPLYRVLQNRLSRLIPLGLSTVWVKLKGDNAFNLGEILNFTFGEWEYLMDATVVVTGNRINFTKLKNLSGLFFQSVRYDTSEIGDKTKWFQFSFINDMIRYFWSTRDFAWFSVDCQGFANPNSDRSLREACRSSLNNVSRWKGTLIDSVGTHPKATTRNSLPHPNTPHNRLNFNDAQARLNDYSLKIKSLRDQIRRQHVAAIRYSIKNTANDIKISKNAENKSLRNIFLSVSKLDNLKDIMKPMIIGLIKNEQIKKKKGINVYK